MECAFCWINQANGRVKLITWQCAQFRQRRREESSGKQSNAGLARPGNGEKSKVRKIKTARRVPRATNRAIRRTRNRIGQAGLPFWIVYPKRTFIISRVYNSVELIVATLQTNDILFSCSQPTGHAVYTSADVFKRQETFENAIF